MRCNPCVALLAWLAIGAVALASHMSCFAPWCQNQRDMDHFHYTNKVGELSLWALRMKAQTRQNIAQAGRQCLAPLYTWREVPLLTSIPRGLKVVSFNNFVWSPWRQQSDINYSPIHPAPDQRAGLTELMNARRNRHPWGMKSNLHLRGTSDTVFYKRPMGLEVLIHIVRLVWQ